MRLYILLLLFFSISTILLAQQNVNWCNNLPANMTVGSFTVNGLNTATVVGCEPFTVKVKSTTDKATFYVYDYKGGDPLGILVKDTTFTYLKQGRYQILQWGNNNTSNVGSIACKVIEVYGQIDFNVKACSGKKVQVTIPSDSTTQRFDQFEIDWGGGLGKDVVTKSANMVFSKTYPATVNVTTIFVRGMVGGQVVPCSGGGGKSIPLSNTNLSSSSISKLTTNTNGTVNLLIRGTSGVFSEIQVSEGGTSSFKPVTSVSPTDTLTVTVKDLDLDKNTYCFRLKSTDGCDNTEVQSNVVCSINIDVQAQNKQNAVSWQTYPNAQGFVNYTLLQDSKTIATISNRSTIGYTDDKVVCGQRYCYQVAAQLAGGVQALSPLRCVVAKSDDKPSALRGTFVDVLEEQKIEVRSDPPATGGSNTFKAIIYRAPNGSNDFVEVAVKQNTLTYKDETADPTKQSYCYKMVYENACGNRSEPTEPMCSIYLYGKGTSTIEWTPESSFLTNPRTYYLEIIDEKGNPVQQQNLGLITVYSPPSSDQQTYRYRILSYSEASSSYPQKQSYSNFFTFERNATVFVADAFSPNGDNMNATFDVYGSFLKTAKLLIYNRWGQLLFETDKIENDSNGKRVLQGWDGTIGGQPAVEGTYVYRVEFTDLLDKKFFKVGSFLLIR